MKELILDGKTIHSKAELHQQVAAQLELPDWYGANLDALYDVLTERRQKIQIILRHQNSLRRHLQDDYEPVMATILDAMEDNASLLLVVESDKQPEQKLWPKKLSAEELVSVYQKHMTEDFPPEERKPLDVLLRMTEEGTYESYGWVDEQGNMMGYAFFVNLPDNRIVSLDYYAVCAAFRGQKNGSRCIADMPKLFPDCAGIVAEVEDPATSKNEEELNVRESRIRFYKKNGLKMTALGTRQYDVDYQIMVLPVKNGEPTENCELDDIGIMYDMDRVYREMFPPLIHAEKIELWHNGEER